MAVGQLYASQSALSRMLLSVVLTLLFVRFTSPCSVRLPVAFSPLLLFGSCSRNFSFPVKTPLFYTAFATEPTSLPELLSLGHFFSLSSTYPASPECPFDSYLPSTTCVARIRSWATLTPFWRPYPHPAPEFGARHSLLLWPPCHPPGFTGHSRLTEATDLISALQPASAVVCDDDFSRESTRGGESCLSPRAQNVLVGPSPIHCWSVKWSGTLKQVPCLDKRRKWRAMKVFRQAGLGCWDSRNERQRPSRTRTEREWATREYVGSCPGSSSSEREQGECRRRRQDSQEEKDGNEGQDDTSRKVCLANLARTPANGTARSRSGRRRNGRKKRRRSLAASQTAFLSVCDFLRLVNCAGASTFLGSRASALQFFPVPRVLLHLKALLSGCPIGMRPAFYPSSLPKASFSRCEPNFFLFPSSPPGAAPGQRVLTAAAGPLRRLSPPSARGSFHLSACGTWTQPASQVSACPLSPSPPPSSFHRVSLTSPAAPPFSSRQSLPHPAAVPSPPSRVVLAPHSQPRLTLPSVYGRRSIRSPTISPVSGSRRSPRKRAPVGVGSLSMKGWGRNSDYSWEEDDETVRVHVVVEGEASGKDVDCVISPRKLFLKLRHRKLPLMEGTLKGRVAVGDSYWCIEELNNNNVRQRSCPPGHSTSTTALPSPCLSPSGAKKVPTDAEMEKKPWLAMDLVESSEATQARSLGRNSADYDSSEHLADPPMSSSDEADETTKIISLYLKKKPPLPSTAAGAASTLPPDWGGVLEGEEVEDIFYDHAPSKMRDLEPRHRSKSWLPGVLLYRQPFPLSFSREDALHFIDAWTRGRTIVGGPSLAAVPSLLARAGTPRGRAPGLTDKDLLGDHANSQLSPHLKAQDGVLLASEAVDTTLDFGLPQTQMMIMVSPLPDGARLSFEGPESLWESRRPHQQATHSVLKANEQSRDENEDARGRDRDRPAYTRSGGTTDTRTAATAAGLDPRSALFGQALALATESQFGKEASGSGGVDAHGDWVAEDGVDLRVLGAEGQAGGKKTGGLELVVLRGPGATGGAGQFGPLLSLKVKDTEERVLRKLQHDLLGVTLAMKEIHLAREQQRKQSHEDLLSDSQRSPCLPAQQLADNSLRQSATSSPSHSPTGTSVDSTSRHSTGLQHTLASPGLPETQLRAGKLYEEAPEAFAPPGGPEKGEGSGSEGQEKQGGDFAGASILKKRTASLLAGSRREEQSSTVRGQENQAASVRGWRPDENDDSRLEAERSDSIHGGRGEKVDGAKGNITGEAAEETKTVASSHDNTKTPGAQEAGQHLGFNPRGPAIVDTSEIDAEWIRKYPGLQKTIEEEQDWLAKFPLKTVKGEVRTTEDLVSLQSSRKDKKGQSTGVEAVREDEEEAERKATEDGLYGIKVTDFSGEKASSMPDFMKNWTPQRRKEFQRDVVYDLKENIRKAQQGKEVLSMADVTRYLQTHLDFTDSEMRQVWQEGHAEAARFLNDPDRSIEGLKEKQQSRKKQWAQHELFFPLQSQNAEHRREDARGDDGGAVEALQQDRLKIFDVMAGPGPEVHSPHTLGYKVLQTEYDRPLHQRWEELSEKEQFAIRVKLQEQEGRFEMLVAELLAVKDESLYPVICDQYKDLLMHEHFLLLMKLRIQENPPQGQKEKDVLVLINKFVVSLYEDLEALALQNEKEQLKKIRLLCMQALVDIDKLTDYAQSMKHLLNRDFFAYLVFAIHEERKRIQKEGNNPDAAPSQWLMVLLIIQKGVTAIYEKEIWEDVLWITMVVTQKPPEVRRKLLELFVAQLPKADWKQFKKVALRMADALAKSDTAAAAFPACPWVPEAVAQLARDLQRILPDWMIEGMMTDFDRQVLKQKLDRMSFLWGEKDLESLRNVNVTLPNVSELMKQEVEEATEIFNMRQGVNERTGEVINAPPPGSSCGF